MNRWERRIWTSDSLSLIVSVLVVIVLSAALTLVGWCINLIGGFDRFKAWWWKRYSGFGHPWDCIAFEITAWKQFSGDCSEEAGDAWGRNALATPPTNGPFGPVRVMGSGNGQ